MMTVQETSYSSTDCTESYEPPVDLYRKMLEQAARIEELEAELLEQARLHGMGSEREARLMGRVAELESAIANSNKYAKQLALEKNLFRANQRISELEAKLAAIENQEPVAWLNEDNRTMRLGTASVCYKYYPEYGYTIPLYTNKIGESHDN